jgi:hypothetical protein
MFLALPLVGLMLALPGLPNLPGFPKLRMPRRAAAPLDSLPPAWKPASRLALENRFVFAVMPPLGQGPVGFRLSQDPRRLRVRMDPDSGTVSVAAEIGNVPLGTSPRVPITQFSQELSRRSFERLWTERSRQSINQRPGAPTAPVPRTGLSFEFPSPLPERVRGLLGPGNPSLTVSGSENIRLSGTSDWTNQQVGLLGQRRSLFPSLDMQQDLDIRLEGRLSDRVGVNLFQNSANQIPLANRIAINYKGDEDDLVQNLDLGNTNLTLPGTQYVSYSGKNEGLFGMKATTRLGPLDFTVLASKQEGRSERASYAGGSSRQNQSLRDMDYIKGVYFFLYDPNLEALEIDETSIRVFLDDGRYDAALTNIVRGRAFVDPRGAVFDSSGIVAPTKSVRGNFKLLTQGADRDYELLSDVYGPLYKVVRLRSPLTDDRQRLAVTYRYRQAGPDGRGFGPVDSVGNTVRADTDGANALTMKLLRPPREVLRADQRTDLYDDSLSVFNRVRELELKNFYALAGQRIDPKTFRLAVRKGDDQPPRTSVLVGGAPVPYIELVGLDSFDESGGFPIDGHDEKVDGTSLTTSTRVLVDFENGILFFPDLRPFQPRVDAAHPFEQLLDTLVFRRARMDGSLGEPNEPNREIYDKQTLLSTDRTYTIDLEFTAARAGGVITLGRSNIIEGSDVITVNGQALVRDRDYRIDYDLGQVTMIKTLGAADNLNIDYSYAPLFQQAGKTLLGSAFRWEGRDRNFGGAFLYESKGAQDLRPRLGEEPSRVLIGDLNTEWRFRPDWVTRMVDALPGVRTTAPSELNISAEVGASFPNPNTRNEVFIDDMEGVRDAVSLSMAADQWRWTSTPEGLDTALVRNTEIRWYTPINAVKERDLKPGLTDAQGAQNSRQTLAISLPRRPDGFGTTPLWAGLTYQIDPSGLDLSRSQFLDIWVNDFRDFHDPSSQVTRVRGRGVKLHVDVGIVSEDQWRAPDAPPNRRLDSEDKEPRDNQLTVTDENNEDTGMDGRANPDSGRVLNLTTASPGDPEGDDFGLPEDAFTDLDPRKWRRTNGTEGNKNLRPVPDTEDLDLDRNLNPFQRYYEYTISLDSTTFQVDSAFGSVFENDKRPVPQDNGWRRFRIPLSAYRGYVGGDNPLKIVRHVRLWLEGMVETDPPPLAEPSGDTKGDGRPFLMIGGLEIVGSRWLLAEADSQTTLNGTTGALDAVNTLDDPEIYRPNFDPGRTRSGSQELARREQSIELEFTRLDSTSTVEAYRTFSLDENYSRYGTLRWIVAGFQSVGAGVTDSLTYFVRFASDERGLNYYEYRARIPTRPEPNVNDLPWRDAALTLTDISNLKLDPLFPKAGIDIHFEAPGKLPNETYTIHGRPSFTRIRRVSFGVTGFTGVEADSGRLWFNELRATDVAKDPDQAQRLTINGRFANLMAYNLSYNGRGADFQSVGESRGSGNQHDALSFGGSFDLHRFFEASGILLPVTFQYNSNRLSPRFTAGDDVVRIGPLAEASETQGSNRSFGVSYSRTWSERSNPFLRYTLGGLSASLTRNEAFNRNPVTVDTSRSLGAAVNYGIAPRRLLELKIPGLGAKFYPLPERFYWNYSLGTSDQRVYDRQRDSTGSLVPRALNKGRTGTIHYGADNRPFDFFHHRVDATRNLTLPEPLREQFGFINLGRVVRWGQAMDARYSFQKYGPWLRPTFSWNTAYNQNNGPELSPDLRMRAINNTHQVSVNWDLPFTSLTSRSVTARAQGDTSRTRPPIAGWRTFLARLGTISTDAQFARSAAHSRVAGSPGFGFLTGLSSDPGFEPDSTGRVVQEFGNRSDYALDWRTGARTRMELGLGASLTTRAEFNSRRNESNAVANKTNRIQFPQMDIEYGRVADVIGLRRLLTNPLLRTSYSRSQTVDFANNSALATNIATSSEWRPLIGLTGDLKNGTRTEFRLERRVTQSENRLLGQSLTTERNTDVNLSVSRSYSQGQKVNFLGKETTVRTNISMGATAVYSRSSGDTRQAGGPPQNPTDNDRIQINAQGSYGFSTNVTGNLELGFLQDRNLQTAIVRRQLRIEMRAQLTF